MDNSPQSIKIAKERFEEAVNKDEREKFEIKVREIDKIECDVDFAIISSNSLNRAELTKKLLSCTIVKYIIFEKFLFQRRSDYSDIHNILKEKKIKAWVNQWMSSSKAFKEMAESFGDDLQEIKIGGKNWGMACNAVHFVDYLDGISGRKGLSLKECSIDNGVIESKRDGYFELTGSVIIQSDDGVELTMSSARLETDGVINIQMIGTDKSLEAVLSIGVVKCNYYDNIHGNTSKEYILPMQSHTTGSIVEDIYDNGHCSLPTYEQSVKQHLVLFDCLESVFKKELKLSNTCPIT